MCILIFFYLQNIPIIINLVNRSKLILFVSTKVIYFYIIAQISTYPHLPE